MTTTMLHLDRLLLRNFRCFAECTIDLHPQLTVLVAENGRGKTAVLDAIGISLGLFVDTIAGTKQSHGFDRTDVRLVSSDGGAMNPVLSTTFEANGDVAGQSIHWSRALKGYSDRARATTKDAEDLRRAAEDLRENVKKSEIESIGEPPLLPLVAFYGTGRLWSEHRLTEGKKLNTMAPNGRMAGYRDCLSSSSSFKEFVAWYENKMNEIRDPRFSAELDKNVPLLTAVQEATQVVLEPSGWSGLDWDFEQKSLVIKHSTHGQLPVSLLSDGVRNMIALVADLAYRCASLNPHLRNEAALRTPGILLIDEVDMHLHPRWQQQIVILLRKAFPLLQMVLTTHSPHVLSSVDVTSIRVIRFDNGTGFLDTPLFQTRGVESSDVLASIMGVDPVPQVEEAQWLSEYRALIEDGRADEQSAMKLRDKLLGHFGGQHPLIIDCDRLKRFQEFKSRISESKES